MPTKLQTEHDASREWWISSEGADEIYTYVPTVPMTKHYVHVREVRPGEITLTRLNLETIFNKHRSLTTANGGSGYVLTDCGAVLAELFPEGTNANE